MTAPRRPDTIHGRRRRSDCGQLPTIPDGLLHSGKVNMYRAGGPPLGDHSWLFWALEPTYGRAEARVRSRGSARTRRPPGRPSQSRSVIVVTEPTSGRRRPLAGSVMHAYCLGCLRDPGSRAASQPSCPARISAGPGCWRWNSSPHRAPPVPGLTLAGHRSWLAPSPGPSALSRARIATVLKSGRSTVRSCP